MKSRSHLEFILHLQTYTYNQNVCSIIALQLIFELKQKKT